MLMFYLSLIEGDEEKALFTKFYYRYERKLYAVALNILKNPNLAEDAVHDAFERIARHFEKFLELYQNRCNEISPWAVTIVKNISLDILEKENRSGALPEDWDAPAPEDTEREDGYRRLVGLIRSMPKGYRQILELKFVCEWSTKEIATHLGLKESAVKQRVSRGRELLLKKLKEEGYEHEPV